MNKHTNNGDYMDLLIVIIRSIFLYIFVILILRIMGKKEIGELSISDLVVSLLIANLAAIAIENYNDSLLNTVVPLITLTLFEIITGKLSLKSKKFRNLIEGKPSLIINKGKINYNEMKRQCYSLDNLLLELRNNGIKNLNDVEYAVLENNGSLNVFEYNKLRLDSENPFPLIVDGEIQYDTLGYINKDHYWLIKYLEDKNLYFKDIFYAFYKSNKIYIIKKSDLI